MTQIDFYHLTQSDLHDALVMLLQKTASVGKKALILCPKPVSAALDDMLWSFDPNAWMPHGVDDADGASHAKVWITTDPAQNQIGAEFGFLTHGVEPQSLGDFERAFVLFDGRSEAQVQQAREQWKRFSSTADVTASYFAQDDDGRWQKKA